MATAYDVGRRLLPETVEAWRAALRPLRPESPYPVLDLGAGTGRFSGHLAGWFDRPVVAVEPAAAMRAQAAARAGDRVWVVAGAAEHLPLAKYAASLAWLSNVVHHFDDLHGAAKELRRVLRLACRVLVRGWFPGLSSDLALWDYFPGAGELARALPSLADVSEAFRPHGFAVEMTLRVDQAVAAGADDYLARLRARADSTLAALSDEEFEEGVRKVEETVRAGRSLPLVEPIDLVVLR